MNHPLIMPLLRSFVIFISIIAPLFSIGQDSLASKWKLGLNISPNFAYQQRSTPRNKAIQMRPVAGIDLGLSLSRMWKNNYLMFSPTVGVTRNKTRSSLAFEDFNVKYLFGGSENRFQASLLYGNFRRINSSMHFNINFGFTAGYGVFNDFIFEDSSYYNEEIRIRNYYMCLSSGAGFTKSFKKYEFYWGLQINQGLLTYTRVHISLNQYQSDFLSKGSSINLVNIIYLNKARKSSND